MARLGMISLRISFSYIQASAEIITPEKSRFTTKIWLPNAFDFPTKGESSSMVDNSLGTIGTGPKRYSTEQNIICLLTSNCPPDFW